MQDGKGSRWSRIWAKISRRLLGRSREVLLLEGRRSELTHGHCPGRNNQLQHSKNGQLLPNWEAKTGALQGDKSDGESHLLPRRLRCIVNLCNSKGNRSRVGKEWKLSGVKKNLQSLSSQKRCCVFHLMLLAQVTSLR